ncbi:HepT-like ribonuclease domain-containing protein [Thiothrix nivea]|uniref:DUF86 domain-containing protein n=1 Tax=Thiothrix nivea (strain ATCC 35100 / DSM 5205 / JP2) TaxID=870187 RepID=A0A656HLI7_THINJ|nr:DUF86 domain-containing protein [Thiothrix nivea]EIJ36180.1 protein of unknown function DUF86 [Thiothrix nivea DSM 5205]
MSLNELRLIDYLEHIAEASCNIGEYLADMDYPAFLTHKMARDAVIRNFEIIGEAAKNIFQRFPEVTEQHSEIPWRALYGMRNALSHGYFKVDLERVWQTAERDLPALHAQISQLLAELQA